MNLTRERIRQVEVKALAKLEALRDMSALRDFVDEGPVGKRRLPQLSKAELANVSGSRSSVKSSSNDNDSDSEWDEQQAEKAQEDAAKPVELNIYEG